MRILCVFVCAVLLACVPARADDAVPAASYFPVLPFDAPADALPQLVPLAANHPLDGAQTGITRAIIIIHDTNRDANTAASSLSALAGGLNATTMILAPQFLLPSDIARFADHLPDRGQSFATWTMSGWPMGDDSTPAPARKGISSFTVVDLLLMYLSDRNSFPDLQNVTIAGYGAGANFTQRYAAFGFAADALAKQNIALRYVVADASSFLYLTSNRPLSGRKGFGRPDAAACPDYDAYPYGLEKLVPYARRFGANAAKTDYALHFITYLNALPPDVMPEINCAALVEGGDSAARADNYHTYLQSLYGEVAEKTQIFAFDKDGKNDAVSLFGSACGMSASFGDGNCTPSFGATP